MIVSYSYMKNIDELIKFYKEKPFNEKARIGDVLFMRAYRSMAYGYRNKNERLTKNILLSYLFLLFDAGGGVNDDQALFLSRVSDINFDESVEYYTKLQEINNEFNNYLASFLSNGNQYVNQDIFELSAIILSLKDNDINDKERQLLDLLSVK